MSEEIIRSEYKYKGKVVNLRIDNVRLPNDQKVVREIVEHRGAVAIVALDRLERVLMVKQYRSAAGREMLEIPAGTMEENEAPEACAPRELKEETGYSARSWEALGDLYSSPGFCTEKMYLYHAQDLAGEEATPEEDEFITVEWVPLAEALQKIDRGEINDAKSIVGLLRVARRLEKSRPS